MDQVEKKERMLKQRIEQLEKENHLLKKSLFDLSLKLNQKGSQSAEKFPEELPEFDTAQPNQSKKLFHEKGELQGHQGAIYCLKFSPNGKFIATGSFDKTVRVWDWKTQMQAECLSEHDLNISDLGWSYDSNFLVSGAYDQTCKVWDIQVAWCLHRQVKV